VREEPKPVIQEQPKSPAQKKPKPVVREEPKPIIHEPQPTAPALAQPAPAKIAEQPKPAPQKAMESPRPSPVRPPIQTAAVTPRPEPFPWLLLSIGGASIVIGGGFALSRVIRRSKSPGSIITQALPRSDFPRRPK
jgi:hypothetical protein